MNRSRMTYRSARERMSYPRSGELKGSKSLLRMGIALSIAFASDDGTAQRAGRVIFVCVIFVRITLDSADRDTPEAQLKPRLKKSKRAPPDPDKSPTRDAPASIPARTCALLQRTPVDVCARANQQERVFIEIQSVLRSLVGRELARSSLQCPLAQ
ncbi:hypothetical protein B0H19DRAFT_1248939 [Mycena capillaripes]|nr:hypothetical protein B0H19DRAFT_1248939 [Mycena capillaripes]